MSQISRSLVRSFAASGIVFPGLNFRRFVFLLALFVLPSVTEAQQVLFSSGSYQPGYNYLYFVAGGDRCCERVGAAFIPTGTTLTGNFTLARIDLAVGDRSATYIPQPFTVLLAEDSGGMPGAVLESWDVTSATSNFSTVVDTLNLQLHSGTQYWLVVEAYWSAPDVLDGWAISNSAVMGLVDISNTSGTSSLSYRALPLFDVQGYGQGLTPPPLGFGFGQYIHLVAGPVTPPAGGPVELTLGFVDFNDNPVGPTLTSTPLSAGQTVSLDLDASTLLTALGQRGEVRPVVSVASVTGAPVATTIAASGQVVDRLTGFGNFVSVNAPTQFPGGPLTLAPMVLAGGEIMRLIVVARDAGAGQLAPGTPGATSNYIPAPCVGQLGFADGNGNPLGPGTPVNLSPGMAASLDLNSASLQLPGGHRIDVQPLVTITASASVPQPSVCVASVEVFDNATGRTRGFEAGQN
jgi:hypothetical protein